jgi:hypothetical protein
VDGGHVLVDTAEVWRANPPPLDGADTGTPGDTGCGCGHGGGAAALVLLPFVRRRRRGVSPAPWNDRSTR